MARLAGQVALITGAGAGIGRAVAQRYVEEGARIVALDRSHERMEALQRELGDSCRIISGDAATADANIRAVELAVNMFGRLDTLVANVGVFDWNKRIERMQVQQLGAGFDAIFAINVKSHLLAFHSALPHLQSARGSVIFTCSNASFRAGGGGALYTASKFAVRGLVLQLAVEAAPTVRVNGIAPGGTITELSGLPELGGEGRSLSQEPRRIAGVAEATPLGFAAKPEDHAALYVTLAARSETPAVTGAIFVSDGGLTISV